MSPVEHSRTVRTGRSLTSTILTFPAVLTIGILLIPVVTDYTDHAVAEKAVGQTWRWFAGHIITAIAFALLINAVSAINTFLRQTARQLPPISLPFTTIGAGLYAAGLGADGIGPLAIQSAGYSPIIFFDGSSIWVPATFAAGTIFVGVGLLSMVIAAIRQELLTGWQRQVSSVSTLIFMVAPMIFSGWALYGVAAASFGIFAPFAQAIQRDKVIHETSSPSGHVG